MISAKRGNELRCRGWRQEGLLRLLENNLENAEAPERLVVYKSTAKVARDWDSFHRIVALLQDIHEDETLVMQSGKPIGRFQTGRSSPLVLMANGNIVGRWGTAESADQLEAQGLTISPGMTAAAWQYIGSQGILQGTYQTFLGVARQEMGADDLRGKWVLTAGCGGMGGAQALAGKMAGAVTLVVEVDESRIRRRIETGYVDQMVRDLDEALKLCKEAKAAQKPLGLAVIGNAAEVFSAIADGDFIPDVVTDQTSTEPDRGYVPAGLSVQETQQLRQTDVTRVRQLAAESIARHVRAMLALKRRGAVVFEYGNNLRLEASRAGVREAFEIPGFVEQYIRPYFFSGTGPFRWISIYGLEEDIHTIDRMILSEFPTSHPICQWIEKARGTVRFQGLPARIGWLGHTERSKLAVLVNQAVRDGVLHGPIAFTRDHLDAGSVAFPFRETEKMRDGSDAIADWPILNALLNAISGADLVAVHGLADYGMSAGVTVVADGQVDTDVRLERVFLADTGMGVHRYADAGYEGAQEFRRQFGLTID